MLLVDLISGIKKGSKLTFRNYPEGTVLKVIKNHTDEEGMKIGMTLCISHINGKTTYQDYRFDGMCHEHPNNDIISVDG